MNYYYKKETNSTFQETVEKIKRGLQSQGFGILTEIDVKKTLKSKLNINYEDYIILGACNPLFAHKALQIEEEIGLLLPCNVIIYSKNKKTYISLINPIRAMSIVKNEKLKSVAKEVWKKLKRSVREIK